MQGHQARLRSNQDYREVLKGGRSVADNLAVLYVLQRSVPEGANRFGVSVPRRFGTAVARNRVRRLFWEAYRQDAALLRPGLDLVLIPRVGARGKGYHDAVSSLHGLLARQRLFAEGVAK
jgi:ribonuclease P protein component